MAKKTRANGEKYKRAIEWLFAKKLNARDVELSLDYDRGIDSNLVNVFVTWRDGKGYVQTLKSDPSAREASRIGCPREYLAWNVHTKSWANLARTLRSGSKSGRRFGWFGRDKLGDGKDVIVFEAGDSLDTALIEADLAGVGVV